MCSDNCANATKENLYSYAIRSESMFVNITVTTYVTRRVKKDMLAANTVLRYRPVKFVKYKEIIGINMLLEFIS